MVPRALSQGKSAVVWVWPLTPLSAEVKEHGCYTSTAPWAFVACKGTTLF